MSNTSQDIFDQIEASPPSSPSPAPAGFDVQYSDLAHTRRLNVLLATGWSAKAAVDYLLSPDWES